ncbi:hypothetical protein UA08_08113 [Talaromyces atroroseus]|uniref:Mid2 domain-containing protein n=1 Tax=Talaromyces atroroseus TaxID=1441469 RepID=A0A225APR5_TALAT|nr:hypothetical protein UA08_08113 [Talaromyces atroroseus]OKL56415.1 hypothetical protein UA08_08113 [Talaromyces atroroseus]
MVRYLGSLCAVAFLQTSWVSLAAASFVNPVLHDLFLRDDSSCATNYTSCGSSYPLDFCCSSDTTCLGLDNYTTVLCCPTGSDCSFIVPITCDMQLQNATAYPTAPVKTTLLSDDPPACGSGCCPFGYTCAKNTTCVLDRSTSSLANSSASASSSLTTASTTVLSTSGPLTIASTTPTTISISDSLPTTATAAATSDASVNSTQTQTAATCQEYPAKAVVAGFFPGAIAGSLVAAIIVMCRRRSAQHEGETTNQKSHRSSRGAIIGISDPIPDEDNGSFRTDFLLRQRFSGRYPTPGTVSRPKSRIRRTGTRVKSIFIGANNNNNNNNRTNPNAVSPQWNSASPPPVPSMPAAREIPVTPPQQTGRLGPREPSTESIKVYSPPNMLGIDHSNRDRNTTFSEVMEQAGFHNDKGEPSYKVTKTPSLSEKSPSQTK